MKIALTLVKLLVFIIAIFVLAENGNQKVLVSLLTAEYPDTPLYVVIILSLTIGSIVGAAFMAFTTIDAKSEVKALKIKNKQIQAELENLRNLSIDEIPDGPLPAIAAPKSASGDA